MWTLKIPCRSFEKILIVAHLEFSHSLLDVELRRSLGLHGPDEVPLLLDLGPEGGEDGFCFWIHRFVDCPSKFQTSLVNLGLGAPNRTLLVREKRTAASGRGEVRLLEPLMVAADHSEGNEAASSSVRKQSNQSLSVG